MFTLAMSPRLQEEIMKGSDDCSLFAWDPESLTAQVSHT